MERSAQEKFPTLVLDNSTSMPLYRQLYESLRSALATGQLKPDRRLPSSRVLADALGVSRTTVQLAFDQLIADGYLEGRPGSGTYVSGSLPAEKLFLTSTQMQQQLPSHDRVISQRTQAVMASSVLAPVLSLGKSWSRAFRLGQPADDAFPHKTWERLLIHNWHLMHHDQLTYSEPAGYLPLREAIAEYLATARGIHCSAKQVIIVNGSQQGIDLVSRVLLNPGEQVWIEDPGYLGAAGAFRAAGARLFPVPLDAEGLSVDFARPRAPDARLAFVTPSHQFPMGMTMSLARRMSLLEWANAANAWILEDDYDGEFRYVGRPLTALYALDATSRVIYMGTFSKTLFPALRVGYLVVPPDLTRTFTRTQLFATMHLPLLEQMVLTSFLSEGHFTRHIRRMRQLYHKRQMLLLHYARQELTGLLNLQPDPSGMHLIGWLPHGHDDQRIARAAAQIGVDISPLSLYSIEARQPPAILLGYTAVNDEEMKAGVEKLAHLLL